MRFLLVLEPVKDGWQETLFRLPGPVILKQRILLRCEAGGRSFPLPPKDELAGLAAGDAAAPLCQGDAGLIRDHAVGLAAKDLTPASMAAFGRYLFATLLGEQAWQALCQEAEQAGDGVIDLGLSWPATQTALTALPWEMMHGPQTYLAALLRPAVALSRVMPGPAPALGPEGSIRLDLPARVLFVLGARLDDPEIRAGAEYIGLLQRLRQEGLDLDMSSRFLFTASSESLQDAVRAFRPAVVHFICHGGLEGGHGFLELCDKDPPYGPQRRSAAALRLLLADESGALPQVVVLNACRSATQPEGELTAQTAAPLGAELVACGVPIVVGMAGQVADGACRLFARRFHEAVLQGLPVSQATAEGRRAGIRHLADFQATVDWAMPTLFLAAGVSPRVDLRPDPRLHQVARTAREYCTGYGNPPVFCDRLDVILAFAELLHGRRADRPQVLAVAAGQRLGGDDRLGMSRLLCHLSSRAVCEDMLPCLAGVPDALNPPEEPALWAAWAILHGLWHAQEIFGLPDFDSQVKLLVDLPRGAAGPPPALHAEVVSELGKYGSPADPRVVRAALRLDILALAGQAGRRPLVLIDDLHRWGQAAGAFLRLLRQDGLGRAGSPIPVVLASALIAPGTEYTSACETIRKYLEEERPTYVRQVPLGRFALPHEARMAYQQFLLSHDPPLVPNLRKPQGAVESVFAQIEEDIEGVPSRLSTHARKTLRLAQRKDIEFLVKADDEDLLRALQDSGGGHG